MILSLTGAWRSGFLVALAAAAVEVERGVGDVEAFPPGDRLRQRSDCLLVEFLDRAAPGADQMMVVGGLAPYVSRHMPGTLEPPGQPRLHQPVDGPEYGRSSDVGMAATHPVVELLYGGLLPHFLEGVGDRLALGREAKPGGAQVRARSLSHVSDDTGCQMPGTFTPQGPVLLGNVAV